MSNKVLIILFFCLVSIGTFAQNIRKAIKHGDHLFEEKNYKGALPYYKEALTQQPEDAYLNFRYGFCLINSPYNRQALPYLQKAYAKNSKIDETITYLLGQAHQLNLEFEEAKISYALFQKYHSSPEDNEIVFKRLKECEFGKLLLENPLEVKIENMGKEINSVFSDYVPLIKADQSELIFTSTRQGTTGDEKDLNGEFFEDIYRSLNVNGKWTFPHNIGEPLNSSHHDATVALSPDGTTLFLYKDHNNGDIYSSVLNGAKWGSPGPLKDINSSYSELHCSISPDGRTIYFSSNRPGGYGGYDIYKSTLDEKGKWSAAVNLGGNVNSPEDEDAPFIHADGTSLYYSSKGHSTMGGYDIFKSHLENGYFTEAQNLGHPINSPDDDIYFVLSADGKTGYYSASKEDTYGEKDIYRISMLQEQAATDIATHKIEVQDQSGKKEFRLNIAQASNVNPVALLKGSVTDAITRQPLQAKISITDNVRNEVVGEVQSNPATGNFLIVLPTGKNYGITVTRESYLFYSENFNIPINTNYREAKLDVNLSKPFVGSKIVLRNIFYDFDKATLRPESSPELQQLFRLLKESNFVVEISGHTDKVGTAEYNKTLSEKRAKSVVDYLITRGISSNRLKYVGLGFSMPMAPDKNPDGTDNPKGRQMNRRTELEIIGNK